MWRKGFGTREEWALLRFVEAPFPPFVSITASGPSMPRVARGGQPLPRAGFQRDSSQQRPPELDSFQLVKILLLPLSCWVTSRASVSTFL